MITSERRANRLSDAGVFAVALLGYLATRSYFFNFDGVACAVAVELADFKHLVHGNHLAYGVLGWAFDRLLKLGGFPGDALYSLQILDGLLGAAGAAALAAFLRRLGAERREAAFGALALSASYAWWQWSLEAQVYMLGAVPLILAASEASSEEPRPWRVGLWHALSMLGHAGHCVAAPALIYLVWAHRRERRDVLSYFAWAAAAVVAAYVLAGLLAVKPGTSDEMRLWLLGSAALGQDRAFKWHIDTSVLESLRLWGLTSLRIFCDFTRVTGPAKALGIVLAVLPLAAAACAFRRPAREAKAMALWLAGHALIYTTWEATTIVYRVVDLPALWALAWMGLDERQVPAKARAVLFAVWTAAAGLYNWHASLAADCDPANNVEFMEAREVGRRTPPEAWVVAHARSQVYYPYFGARRPLNLRFHGTPEALAAAVAAREARGEPVYATGRTLKSFPGLTRDVRVEKLEGDLLRLRPGARRPAQMPLRKSL